MKTDEEVSERVHRASHAVQPPVDPLERLYRRRETKRHRERLTAAGIAIVLLVAAVGGSLFAVARVWSGHGRAGMSSGWTPDRPLELRPGQFFYLKGTVLGTGDGSRITQETWWAPDGSGELRFDTNRPDKYVPYPPEGVYDTGKFPLPYQDDLSSLSTDPKILEVQLRNRADRYGDTMWRAILNLLDFERSPQALPELRAALFEVAAGLGGVTREVDAEDPVGRNAVALDFTDHGKCVADQCPRWVLFFDPGTHQLMDEAVGFLEDPVPFLVLDAAIVNSRGEQPTDDQLLFPMSLRQLRLRPQPSPSVP